MAHHGRSSAAQFFLDNPEYGEGEDEEDYSGSSGGRSAGGRRTSSSGLGGSGTSRLSSSRMESSFEANDYQDEVEV